MGRIAVAVIVSSLVIPVSILVNRVVPDPYMVLFFNYLLHMCVYCIHIFTYIRVCIEVLVCINYDLLCMYRMRYSMCLRRSNTARGISQVGIPWSPLLLDCELHDKPFVLFFHWFINSCVFKQLVGLKFGKKRINALQITLLKLGCAIWGWRCELIIFRLVIQKLVWRKNDNWS